MSCASEARLKNGAALPEYAIRLAVIAAISLGALCHAGYTAKRVLQQATAAIQAAGTPDGGSLIGRME
jgi:hypothetical protein